MQQPYAVTLCNSPMQSPFFLSKIVTFSNPNPTIALLPRGADIEDVTIHVLTAFDAGRSMSIGYASDNDAYSAAISVATTGRKKPTLGTGVGLDTSARQVRAYITGGTPTQGEAIVVLDGKILRPSI